MPSFRPAASKALTQETSELSPLGRAARLLEDAQRSLERAGDDAERCNREMAQRIQDLEQNLGEMEQLLVRTERQAAQLANLYVATYQLHASLEPGDVRAAIADIAVNLLGAERFAILIQDEAGQLVASSESAASDAAQPPPAYTSGDALIDAALQHGSPQFGPSEGSQALVAVPFTCQGEIVGVLVVNAFLGHKPGLNDEDHELLDLMAAHAASAVLASRAFHVSRRKLTAYEGLLGFLRGGAT